MFSHAQQVICDQYGAVLDLPELHSMLGWSATAITGVEPLNGLRHRPGTHTCGWYVWGGTELLEDADFFQSTHVHHMVDKCAEIIPFLGLPPGWRFLVAPGHVDVWFDESLLAHEG